MAGNKSANKYKIKLSSGRVLGPLDVERVAKLIRKGHVRGDELARLHPDGDWKVLAQHSELAQLVLSLVSGMAIGATQNPSDERSAGRVLDAAAVATQVMAATQILPEQKPEAAAPALTASGAATGKAFIELIEPDVSQAPSPPGTASEVSAAIPTAKSIVLDESSSSASHSGGGGNEEEGKEGRTVVVPLFEQEEDGTSVDISVTPEGVPKAFDITHEKTVVFRRSSASPTLPGRLSVSPRERTKSIILFLVAIFLGIELFSEDFGPKKKAAERVEEVRPRIPSVTEKKGDPIASQKQYAEGLDRYRYDSIPDYRKAVVSFTKAVELDPHNVRAMAMLASSYLNLIDVSNKDETYFSVISKLIELSKAKDVDLPETLIAEVEYLLFSQRSAAAQGRIIDYTKSHKNYDSIMLVYLAQVLLSRGDYATAARYLSPISDDRPYKAKVFYLRGRVAEGLGDADSAIAQYKKAIEANPRHGLSYYRTLKVLESRAELKKGRQYLRVIAKHPEILPYRELAQALSWGATVEEAEGKIDLALGLVERALRLDPDNPAYSLQYYLLHARAGDSMPAIRKEARLYYYLAEGERLAREGRIEEALSQFLEARRENPKSALPLVKRGDLFYYVKKDIVNAKLTYKKAAELAPRDVRVWSKYIELLIQSYEWEDAANALKRFKTLPVSQGIIDKISADWHERQGQHADAQAYYVRAMSRSFIEPSVYLAYGKSLLATKNFKQAPFIFSLALRLDPENHEAILGTAEALAGSEGIDRGISYLRDELQKGRGTRVELLSGIASLLIRKGSLDQAEELIEQAKTLRPEASQPWKVEAELALARGTEKKWREKAEAAYGAYLDRNPSDAKVMYERYRVLVDLEKYEFADYELGKIYQSYPKFPSLRYSKGLIYMRLSNYKAAIREFEQELKNGNNSTQNLIELGRAHFEVREFDKALGYFIRAIKRGPNESEPKFQAGRANFAMARYDAAIAMYQEALKTDFGNPLIYRHLGYAYRAAGDQQGMRWAFGKYLEMEPDAADKAEIQRNL